MSKRLTDLRSGALFVLLYHVTIIVFYQLVAWMEPYAFQCFSIQLNLLPPLILLLVFTPYLFLTIREFRRTTLLLHVILAATTILQSEWSYSIFIVYIFFAPISILPLYFLCFEKRSAFVGWGALIAHLFLTVLGYLVGSLGFGAWLKQTMLELTGSAENMILLWLVFIARSILPLIPIGIHLLKSLIQWGFSTYDAKHSIE